MMSMSKELNVISEIDEELMLTTIDNPYNPKTDYVNWRIWDVENEYRTEEYIARMTDLSDDVDLGNDWVVNGLTNDAINSILENDVLGIYKLV